VKYNFNLGADNGNVVGITNNRDTTRSQAFTYDQVNRIATGQTPAPCGSNCWSQTFSYDQWANLQAVAATGTAPPLTNMAVNTSNRITLTGFNYDTAGNELSDVTSTYVWNAESEIKTGGGINYSYDGDGDRVQKSNGKIYWYGAGSQVLDESDASGNITDEYIYFGGKRVAHRVVSGNSVYFYAEDMLGSSRALATSTGTLCYDADFFPYGGEKDYVNSCPQNYKFTGKERDPKTNNDDFDARYYSSAYGRFLSADWSSTPSPVPYANLTNPQTLNLYAMVSDNPESFADLDGHETNVQSNSEPGNCAASGSAACGAQKAEQNAGTAQNQTQQYDSKKSGPEDPTNPGKPLSQNPIVKKASDAAFAKTRNGTARGGLAEAGFSAEYKDGKISIANKTDSVNSDKPANGLKIYADGDTIAIVHTHGNGAVPTPSPGDLNPKVQVPDFVRSQRSLYVTLPNSTTADHPATNSYIQLQ
jgi:RHS repeat-associated protein